MAIYCEFEGVKGNVTAEGYADHIALEQVNFGVGRGISMEVGNLANREATRPTFSEISFVKMMDNSCINLFKQSVVGKDGCTVKIKFVRTGGDALEQFMEYELTNALISSYSISADAEGEPVENVTISFSKFMTTYTDSPDSNTGGSQCVAGYDLTCGKVV